MKEGQVVLKRHIYCKQAGEERGWGNAKAAPQQEIAFKTIITLVINWQNLPTYVVISPQTITKVSAASYPAVVVMLLPLWPIHRF